MKIGGNLRVRVSEETKELLRRLADKYENEFPTPDPSEFMNKASGRRNRESTAFVASCLSFGSIGQFNPKIERLVGYAQGNVDGWIRNGLFERTIPADACRCFYRFITYANLNAFLRAYQRVMRDHGTLGGYVESCGDGTGLGAMKAICAAFAGSDVGYLVPANTSSACKRLCMFLRWMVRESSVDIGLWKGFIDRATLVMPLDTHVLEQARRLKLLSRETASMSTARKLTAVMDEVFPGDPLRGDFALFGQGRSESGPILHLSR